MRPSRCCAKRLRDSARPCPTLIGKRVCLTKNAVAKLAEHLKLFPVRAAAILAAQKTAPPPDDPSQKNAPPAPAHALDGGTPPVFQRLLVARTGVKNRRVLLCVLPGGDPTNPRDLQTVRVRDNIHFIPKTPTGEILARHISGNLWEFAGNPRATTHDAPRCPRWRGKW